MSSAHAEADQDAHAVLGEYGITASALVPLTHGLINTTWRVETAAGVRHVLQRLHPSFAPEVNLNLECVTRFLAERGRPTPRLCPTRAGTWWVQRGPVVWRLLTFIDGVSFTALPDLAHAVAAGQLLGEFHATLVDFTAPLPCVRPPVHEPARHRACLHQSLADHPAHRLAAAVARLATEIDDALAVVAPVPITPLRLVHGDPKLSNLMFDARGDGLCMVDLDTLARAPLAYELGDALRSWCNPWPEDATDAHFDLAIFEAALTGYAAASAAFLTSTEAASLAAATETIHLELAMRFGADALNERYFGWDPARFATRGDHNLRRAQNQLSCARQLAARRTDATQILQRVLPMARATRSVAR